MLYNNRAPYYYGNGLGSAIGPAGLIGPARVGIVGLAGPAGPARPATPAAIVVYANVYNVGAQTVTIEADATLDTNRPLLGATHASGATAVVLTAAGTYFFTYTMSGTELNQFALYANRVLIPRSISGSGAGTQVNTGQVIATMAARTAITLHNHTSAAAVTLATLISGTATNNNASIVILGLAL